MTKLLIIICTVSLMFVGIVFCNVPKAQAAASERDVVFYEIMWAGPNELTSDEWFVLKNNTDTDITLNGWRVTNLKIDGTEEQPLASLTGKIPSREFFLVSRKSKIESPILDIERDNTISSSLSNENLQLKLYDGELNPIDIAGDGSKPLAGSNTKPKSSMLRKDVGIDGVQKEAWVSNTAQCNLDSGSTELATPQSSDPNTNCHPPNIDLENEIPDTLKIGETFSTQLNIIDKGDINDVKIIGSSVTIDDNNVSVSCTDVGTKDISIIATDSKGSKDQINKTIKCYDDGKVVINEVLPHPEKIDYNQSGKVDSGDEWVELYNNEDKPVNLAGWQIGDKPKPNNINNYLSDKNNIAPKGYLTLFKSDTKITLNDDGDSVYLYNPSGVLVSSITYSYVKNMEDMAWAKFDNEYKWTTTPTFGAQNVLTEIASTAQGGPVVEAVDSTSSPPSQDDEPTKTTRKITTKKTVTSPASRIVLATYSLPKLSGRDRNTFWQNNYLEQTNTPKNDWYRWSIGLFGLLALARTCYNMLLLYL